MGSGAWPSRGWWVAGLILGLGGARLADQQSWATLWQLPVAGGSAVLFVLLASWGFSRVLPGAGPPSVDSFGTRTEASAPTGGSQESES